VQVAILLFDGMVALDAIGPYDVLKLVPGAEIRLVAAQAGAIATDGPLRLVAGDPLAAVPRPDVIVIPGGPGATAAAGDERHLRWLRAAHDHATWTTSVCTGSELLGAAGLLDGIAATSHWLIRDELPRHGATPLDERVVVRGRIITCAGVSAGIDMALTVAALIAGDDVAQRIQLTLEYAPQPPFHGGSPATAPPGLVDELRAGYAGTAIAARRSASPMIARTPGES
jgi:putative intracellular protease/amidase